MVFPLIAAIAAPLIEKVVSGVASNALNSNNNNSSNGSIFGNTSAPQPNIDQLDLVNSK
jgi:hypothetical protein